MSVTCREDELSVFTEQPLHISVKIAPRLKDAKDQQYVYVTLQLLAGGEYPDIPANVALMDVKGERLHLPSLSSL